MATYKSIKYNISGADLTGLTAGQIPNLDASKITTGTLNNARISLDAAEIPNLDTAKTTTGTFANARISAGSVTQHVTATDLTPVRQDVLTLALKQAVQENSTKFNLPNSAITKFEADADFNLAGSTTIGRNASEYISAVSGSVGEFSNDSNTKLLLHFNGADEATSTTDASDSSHGITFNGGAQLDTAIKKFGTASYINNGTLDITGTTSDFNHGTDDWTYECWVYPTSFASTAKVVWMQGTHDSAGEILARYNTSAQINCEHRNNSNTMASITGSTTNSADAWHHLAVTKQTASNLIRVYLNGVQEATVATSGSYGSSTELHIGNLTGYSQYFDGNIDEFRVSNNNRYPDGTTFTPNSTLAVNATGTALGTTNVPTSAVTDVSGVMLLKDAYGTTTLGTDVKAYFTADNSNWTEATSYADAGTFSTGIKMIKLGKATCTSGSDVRWKIVWANQVASSKEAQIYGIGLNY